jgi:hypothetical protein
VSSPRAPSSLGQPAAGDDVPEGVAHRLRHSQDRNGRPRFRSMRYPQLRKARAVIGSNRSPPPSHRRGTRPRSNARPQPEAAWRHPLSAASGHTPSDPESRLGDTPGPHRRPRAAWSKRDISTDRSRLRVQQNSDSRALCPDARTGRENDVVLLIRIPVGLSVGAYGRGSWVPV